MARGRPRNAPPLSMREEIHRRGVIAMMESVATTPAPPTADASDMMATSFVAWAAINRAEDFNQLVEEFAMAQIEEMRRDATAA